MSNYNILKSLCKKIYMTGLGNFWYEPNIIEDDASLKYKAYMAVLFSVYGLMTILEILAALFGDFSEDENRDSITLAVCHTLDMIKIFSVIFNKDLVKRINQKLVMVCSIHEEDELMIEQYKVIKFNIIPYLVAVCGAAACFVYEGIRKYTEGSQFVTVVTYWPSSNDDSISGDACRILTTILLFIMLVNIVSVDCSAMIYLIIYKYKFVTLKKYFENLRDDFDQNFEDNERSATDILTEGVIRGIVMHEELLSLSKDIDTAFGTVMACQILQSSGGAVSLLLQIALADQLTLAGVMKIIFFVASLLFVLGLFLCNAGEITYQASLISDAIFYCGWHASLPTRRGRDLRQLVCFACARAQRPLAMKVFKVVELTYATFITVLRSTYSVFALFYAQNK
nr:odorant receptor 13 [Achelura yunnanensis]